MKYAPRILLSSFILGLLLLLTFTTVSKGLTFQNQSETETYTLTEDIDDDLFVIGENYVVIEGDVNGDLFVIGSDVVIKGEVTGNLFVLSKKTTIDNIIGKSLFALTGDFNFSGDVARDAFVASRDAFVMGNIAEDLSIISLQRTYVEGIVGDDVRIFASDVTLKSDVSDDLLLGASMPSEVSGDIGGSLALLGDTDFQINSAVIEEDLLTYGAGNFIVSPNTFVGGETLRETLPMMRTMNFYENSSDSRYLLSNVAFKALYSISQVVGLVFVGYLLLKFSPIRVDSTLSQLNSVGGYIKSTIVGFSLFPIGFLLGIFLVFSIFGWPLLKFLFFLFLLASVITGPLAGLWLGRLIFEKLNIKRRYVVPLAFGLLLLAILKLIPVFGYIVYAFIEVAVLGALVRMQWNKYKVAQHVFLKKKK